MIELDHKEGDHPLVSVVISAYNEHETVGGVVTVAMTAGFTDVIVVDDGSEDNTAETARQAGATVVQLSNNQGKGAAMQAGLKAISSQVAVVLFWDADLLGVRVTDFENVYRPVQNGKYDMVFGVLPTLEQRFVAELSGARALPVQMAHQFFEDMQVRGQDVANFSIERRLNDWFAQNNLRRSRVMLSEDIEHRFKMVKRGFVQGFWDDVVMFWEVLFSR